MKDSDEKVSKIWNLQNKKFFIWNNYDMNEKEFSLRKKIKEEIHKFEGEICMRFDMQSFLNK